MECDCGAKYVKDGFHAHWCKTKNEDSDLDDLSDFEEIQIDVYQQPICISNKEKETNLDLISRYWL